MFVTPYCFRRYYPNPRLTPTACHSERSEEPWFRRNHTLASAPVFASSDIRHHPAQKNIAHLACKLSGVSIDPRVMPRIDPIHHAEKAEHSDARRELQSPIPLEFIQQADADSVIFPLDGSNLGSKTVLQRFRFV